MLRKSAQGDDDDAVLPSMKPPAGGRCHVPSLGSTQASSVPSGSPSPSSSSCSTETESEELDGLLEELNRWMADYMLREDDHSASETNLIQRKSLEGFRNDQRQARTEYWERGVHGGQYRHNHGKPKGDYVIRVPLIHPPAAGRTKGRSSTSAFGGADPEYKSRATGTGVFLPRGAKLEAEPAKKPKKRGCSTVLVPTRVLQALNQHFSSMDYRPPRSSNLCDGLFIYHPKHDDDHNLMATTGIDNSYAKEKPSSQSAVNQQELNLPREWSYN